MLVLTGVLAVGCQSIEGDPPEDDVYGITVIRCASASTGPDILTVSRPAGAAALLSHLELLRKRDGERSERL